MGIILTKRERYIIRRKDNGKIFCGLARNFQFKSPEDIKGASVKTYRSARQALAAFQSSWGADDSEIEVVKVVEQLEVV